MVIFTEYDDDDDDIEEIGRYRMISDDLDRYVYRNPRFKILDVNVPIVVACAVGDISEKPILDDDDGDCAVPDFPSGYTEAACCYSSKTLADLANAGILTSVPCVTRNTYPRIFCRKATDIIITGEYMIQMPCVCGEWLVPGRKKRRKKSVTVA